MTAFAVQLGAFAENVTRRRFSICLRRKAPTGNLSRSLCYNTAIVRKVLQSCFSSRKWISSSPMSARDSKVPRKLAQVDTRVATAKSELDASESAKVATVKDQKKYKLDIDQWKNKVRKYRNQTAQVKTNEAYRAHRHEVQMAEDKCQGQTASSSKW